MGRIPQDVIDRVLALHDIVELVGRSVPLKKAGRAWKALCPFHDEKTPSFTVDPVRQTFKCFGCGKGGNAFGWLMERDGLRFHEAVRTLAAEKGVVVPDVVGGRGDAPDVSKVTAIREAVALAQDLYVRTLWGPEGAHARAYLEKRGFPPPASKALGLGLSPEGWDGLITAAKAKGVRAEVLEDAGLAVRRERGDGHYDRFRARLMFPIADVSGRIVTYGARALREGDQPKYLNGPETPVFTKGRTLYALDRAKDGIRKVGYSILMEGYTDVLMAHLHGFTAAVAGMGTALTPEQARMLARFAPKVVLLYDGDAAGRAAAEKNLDLVLEQGLEVRVALLPEGRDVDEVLLEEGVEALAAILDRALDVFDFKAGQLAATLDLGTERGRAQAAERMADVIVRVKSPIERDLLFPRVAERLRVRETLLRAEAGRLLAARAAAGLRRLVDGEPGGAPRGVSGGGPGAPAAVPADPHARSRRDDLRRAQERFVSCALHLPDRAGEVREVLSADELEDEALRVVYGAVLGLLDQGLSPAPDAVHRVVSGDPEASAALASLPDDFPFDDWLTDAVRQRRTVRAQEDRRRAVLQWLAGPGPSAQDGPPGGAPGAS